MRVPWVICRYMLPEGIENVSEDETFLQSGIGVLEKEALV